MKTKMFLAVILATAALIGGCAADSSSEETESANADLTKQLSDVQLEGKLKGILDGVTYTSESDYPYVVFEGDTVPAGTRLGSTLVRQKLSAWIKANTEEHRDVTLKACRARRLNVSETIAAGDAAQVPADKTSDEYLYGHHDKQLGIALKTMRSQLTSVVGLTFGEDQNGDEDQVGPILRVFVGVSKTSGKLIAIMTEDVAT